MSLSCQITLRCDGCNSLLKVAGSIKIHRVIIAADTLDKEFQREGGTFVIGPRNAPLHFCRKCADKAAV